MTSARRTPHYSATIGSEPMGPHLLGPEPVAPAPAAAPHPFHGRRASSSGVIPFHGLPAAPVIPTPSVVDTPAAPPPQAPARRRKRVVPVALRPVRVLVISAAPGAAPRSFEVARWQARTAIAAFATITLLACGFVGAVTVAVRAPDLFVDNSEVEALRAELSAVRDSLESARAEATAPAAAADSAASAAAPGAKPATPVPAASAPRPRPLSARPVRRVAPEASGLLPRSLADLPVIGALASGFSRARRHPLLHLTRPHLGVDVAAPRGTRVSAPAPGRVQFVGRKIGFGLVVELDHGHGVTTRYAHLRSSAVEVGEQVTKGEAIAAVGTSGITTGPHLHYEVLVRGRQVDPLRYRFPGEPAEAPAAPAVPAAAVAGPAAPASGAGSAVGTHEAPAPMAPVPGPR